ncbi:hypothetical protein KKC44_06655, partial [Patescibacteria group bacterium]|nr:hypothetical protein [Patescibacteria group bacterium]
KRGIVLQSYNRLMGVVGEGEGGVDGYIQDTAYAVMALSTVGGNANQPANNLAKWLATQQEASGGWLEDGIEYPEADGEALRAISATIGANVTIDGFKPGKFKGKMSWRRVAEKEKKAKPF